MKKLKNIFILIVLFVILLVLFTSVKVFAVNSANSFEMVEYSDEFKNWLELSDEEKEHVMMPRMYKVPYSGVLRKNPISIVNMLKASADPSFNLKSVIDIDIKDQMQTNSCWAFANLSSLETNLALFNHKNSLPKKTYDFSERHMEYATSRTFSNGEINKLGYNRNVGSGGNYLISQSYLTNGSGAIPEDEMKFENNETTISIDKIQNKTVSSQVYDTVYFPDYQTDTGVNTDIMNQVKQHIQEYGSVSASIHGDSSNLADDISCYKNSTGAKYCKDSSNHKMDHAVSIIGWNDNYEVSNFVDGAKPKSPGAWIIRNSWGEKIEYELSDFKNQVFQVYKDSYHWSSVNDVTDDFIQRLGYTISDNKASIKYGDNGLIYVSYEDANISKNMYGIIKASDSVDYDYIYQYDEFFPISQATLSNYPDCMLCSVFKKNSNNSEYLTQVSLHASEKYTCKVYVNPNGTGKSKSELQLVPLKEGDSETFDAGYHTLEFAKPVEITGNSFAVVVQIHGFTSNVTVPLETKSSDVRLAQWNCVTTQTDKCFLARGNNLESCIWSDLGDSSADSTIKAFTTTELNDGSLKNIVITQPPEKVSYFEGEDFNKAGMIITANYNSKTKPSAVLDSESYSIIDGSNLKAGQTSVTIKYLDKTVEQPISVEKDTVTELRIKNPATTLTYKEGQSFDKTGLIIEAVYKSGAVKTISDYEILDGNNLRGTQTKVTISYEGKTVDLAITITPNPLLNIIVSKQPDKTNYVVGQNFDPTGMVITGNYQDGNSYEIIDFIVENGTNLTINQSSVTISFDGKTTTQPITVEGKSVVSVVVDKLPSKLTYIQNEESLDLTGGSLKVTYDDDSSETVSMTSNNVEVTGFSNSSLGKVAITVSYQGKSCQFDVEVVAPEKIENSKLDSAKCNIEKLQVYHFTDDSDKDYVLFDVEIDNVSMNLANDNVEYYYYLSTSANEQNIDDWIKISDIQITTDKLHFKIDSRDVSNFASLSSQDAIYLYVKEVVKKDGNQSVTISNPMKLDSDVTVETYVDNAKKDNFDLSDYVNPGSDDSNNNGYTVKRLPNAGFKITFIAFVIILGIGFFLFIRYKKLSKYIK